MKSPRIAWGLFGGFLLVSVVPLAVLSQLYLRDFEQRLTQQALHELGSIADKKVDQIGAYLFERRLDIESLARSRDVQGALAALSLPDVERPAALLSHLDAGFAAYRSDYRYHDLLLIDTQGNVVFSLAGEDDLGTNLLSGPWRTTGLAQGYSDALSQLGVTLTAFQPYAPSGGLGSAFLVAPVLDAGRIEGAVALQIKLGNLLEVATDDTGLGQTGETVLAQDENERALYINPLKRIPDAAFRYEPVIETVAQPMQLALSGARGTGVTYDYAGEEVVAAWRYIPDANWGMVVKIDTREALQAVQAMRQKWLWALVGLLLLVTVIAAALGRSLVTPLERLTAISRRIAAGELQLRAIPCGWRELGELAQRFNRMADALREERDTLEQRVAERTEALRLAASVFSSAREGVMICDAQNRIIEVNPAFSQITGYTREEVMGRAPGLLASGQHPPEFFAFLWEKLRETGAWRGEIINRRKNGELYPEQLSITILRNPAGELTHYVAVFSDISYLKVHEEELERMANYDSLTGLPNRRLLADRIQQGIAHARREGHPLALAVLDLDGFKPVNDQYGHEAGDRVLREIASRLTTALRHGDTVARLGGDEFVLVMLNIDTLAEVELITTRVLNAIAQPMVFDQEIIHVSASIGLTLYPDDPVDADTLLRHADQAMYLSKQQGKNRFHFFDAAHDREIQAHHLALERLNAALHDGEFELYYQPKVNMQAGTVIGAEALIRWNHPEQGLLTPARFLPTLNNTPLEVELGYWVIASALHQAQRWREQGLDLPVGVNLSVHHLMQPDFVERLAMLLAAHPGLPPASLELEILVSAAVEDWGQIVDTLTLCRKQGVGFALDDFGTGYSSLLQLRRLSVDTLKIDQGVVRDMLQDPDDRAIVESVIRLADSFQCRAVAEGVETLEHAQALVRMGCLLGQGYGIAHPMPACEMAQWIERWQAGAPLSPPGIRRVKPSCEYLHDSGTGLSCKPRSLPAPRQKEQHDVYRQDSSDHPRPGLVWPVQR